MEAIFMGAITWAIIGICYMIYSEFQGSDKMFNRRLLQATSGGIFLFPLMFLPPVLFRHEINITLKIVWNICRHLPFPKM